MTRSRTQHGLVVLMFLHAVVFGVFALTRGHEHPAYAFLAGASLASTVFMVAWLAVERRPSP